MPILRIYLSAFVTCRGNIVLLHRIRGLTLEDLRGAEAAIPALVAEAVGSQQPPPHAISRGKAFGLCGTWGHVCCVTEGW